MKNCILLAVMFFVFGANAQQRVTEHIMSFDKDSIAPNASLEEIAWISGNWKGKAFGGDVEENWTEPSGDSMMATFKLVKQGKVSFYEIEVIRQVNKTLILQLKHFNGDLTGWETKNETVDFPLVKITDEAVYFDGMTFEKLSENQMNVYVLMRQKDGKGTELKFEYKK